MSKYKLIVSGGTFDRFHKGHEVFLSQQLKISDKVLLGITSDTYVKKSKGAAVESYAIREKAVQSFFRKNHAGLRVTIVPIEDAGIPDEWQVLPIEAIVVTNSTKKGAEQINEERKRKGLFVLPIEVVQLSTSPDGKAVSSTRIRSGEINRQGSVYLPRSMTEKNYALPFFLRDTLKKPFGKLIVNNAFDYQSLDMSYVVTVGDVATRTFLDRRLSPQLAVVDFVVERKRRYEKLSDIGFSGDEMILKADNPPGSVTTSLLNALQKAFSRLEQRIVVLVNGEEDLAVMPIILFAPLGYMVFYGQPGEGIVVVTVTESQKEVAYDLFHRLEAREN